MANSNRTLCGIYQIRNLINGKVYIGSSARVLPRWAMHRSQLRRGVHHSTYLQRAWIKYGESSFAFEIIEEIRNPHDLIEAENRHIARLKSANAAHGYNVCPAAGTTLGVKLGPHSEERRKKIGLAQKGKVISDIAKAKLSAARKGLVLSEQWRENLRRAMTGKKMGPLSAAHKALISSVHKGKKLSEEQKATLLAANKGRKQTDEDRRNKSASGAAYWATQTPEQRLARIMKTIETRKRNKAMKQLSLLPASQV